VKNDRARSTTHTAALHAGNELPADLRPISACVNRGVRCKFLCPRLAATLRAARLRPAPAALFPSEIYSPVRAASGVALEAASETTGPPLPRGARETGSKENREQLTESTSHRRYRAITLPRCRGLPSTRTKEPRTAPRTTREHQLSHLPRPGPHRQLAPGAPSTIGITTSHSTACCQLEINRRSAIPLSLARNRRRRRLRCKRH